MKKILFSLSIGSLILSSCYHRPPPVVSEAQPGDVYLHQFSPDYINYGVCHDTLAAVWGKESGQKLDLWVSWSTKPLLWEGHLYAGSVDTSVLSEWGSIPAKAPFDFDCRQGLLTNTTQSKNFEIYKSPVNAPFRCSSLYDRWLTIVDRKTRRAYPTGISTMTESEIFEWKGKLWLGNHEGVYLVDPMALAMDTDNDGLTDLMEHLIGTSLDQKDSDEDGVPDAIDEQPLAAKRTWTAADSLFAKKLQEAVYKMSSANACVNFINVVAPDQEPLEIPLYTGTRLLWNVDQWAGDSVVIRE
jgi:hypothetical protein